MIFMIIYLVDPQCVMDPVREKRPVM